MLGRGGAHLRRADRSGHGHPGNLPRGRSRGSAERIRMGRVFALVGRIEGASRQGVGDDAAPPRARARHG